MLDLALNSAAVISLYFAVGWCLKHKTAKDIDEASLMPFADDPEVARRVELATGKPSMPCRLPSQSRPSRVGASWNCKIGRMALRQIKSAPLVALGTHSAAFCHSGFNELLIDNALNLYCH
jgi:hypothetical protein